MSDQPAVGTVTFEHVSKRYRLGTVNTLRSAVSKLLSRGDNSTEGERLIWALRDVSFQVAPGESLGIIGPNGAGKTTALKLLSNVTRPTSGQIGVHGRVSSLIELGAGFHPELTGRENIYLNGSILGLRRHEIRRKLDDIIAFSELERFIDTPVKRYSSGMYVRLGFAVAAHMEPDILLVDEVLAVGDASFRHRCVKRMQALQQNGTSVIFVSHNMHLVRSMCSRVLLLLHGQVHTQGEPSSLIAEYERLLLNTTAGPSPRAQPAEPGFESYGAIVLTAAEIVSDNADKAVASHLPARLKIYYKTAFPQPIGRIDIRILREDGTLCATADSSQSAPTGLELGELSGNGVIEVTYNPLQLTTGTYAFVVRITDPSDSLVVASIQSEPFQILARGAGQDRGVFVPLVRWAKYDLEAQPASARS
jgi:lipopolysaccharide transport system ATP-binding protein